VITVLETKVENNEVWIKVKLERNTDILQKELYTEQDIKNAKEDAIIEFLNWQKEQFENRK